MNKCVVAILSMAVGYATVGLVKADDSPEKMGADNVYLRPILGLGYTTFNNGVAATYDNSVSSGIDRINLNGGFGAQVLTDITPKLKLGVEASFTHWVNETTSLKNHPLSPSGEEYCYHTINTLALMEFKISEQFFIQAGSGLAASIKPNNRFTGTTPYFMIAPGMNFQLSSHTTIPVMVRLSSLETGKGNFGTGDGFGSMLPITIVTGVTLSF